MPKSLSDFQHGGYGRDRGAGLLSQLDELAFEGGAVSALGGLKRISGSFHGGVHLSGLSAHHLGGQLPGYCRAHQFRARMVFVGRLPTFG